MAAPTRVLMQDPCPLGLPELLTVAHMSAYTVVAKNITCLSLLEAPYQYNQLPKPSFLKFHIFATWDFKIRAYTNCGFAYPYGNHHHKVLTGHAPNCQ